MNMGGAEVMLMDMYRNISANINFDFLVNYNTKVGKVEGDFDSEIRSKGGSIRYIGAQWDIGPMNYLKAFKNEYMLLGKPEIVHIHMNAKSGIIAWAAAKAGAKKIIVHSHADLKIRGSRIKVFLSKLELKFQQWLMAKYATDYWGCSQEANESLFYKRLLTPEHSAIINNAVDVNKFHSVSEDQISALRLTYGIGPNTIVLGNVGRIVRHKNIGFVIELLPKLVDIGYDVRFVIAGREDDQDYTAEIRKRAQELKVEDRILFLGSREDVEVVMQSFDVFVGPALQEGFGLVAVEAQAAGKPCVLYKGFPKSVDMGLDLVSFHSNFDIDYWIDAILQAIKYKKIANNKIAKAITLMGYNSIENTKKIEELYSNS